VGARQSIFVAKFATRGKQMAKKTRKPMKKRKKLRGGKLQKKVSTLVKIDFGG
jgi:hypothetical protein